MRRRRVGISRPWPLIGAFAALGLILMLWPIATTAKESEVPSWTEASDFIRAIAELFKALQWPAVALIVAIFFHSDISLFLLRIKEGELWGGKVKLRELVNDFVEASPEGTSANIFADATGQ